MQTFMANRGVVTAILDHDVRTRALNGKEQRCMHLQVEWEGQEERSYSWEPFTSIFRDVPNIVTEYFDLKQVDIRELLEEESRARDKTQYLRGNHR